ncbi:MAG: Mth938-like domain-containing protein, partial [Gallionellaceae bacterium]|nr:Mth938-like domain-containing protein [Gallionellaceae bacterium]
MRASRFAGPVPMVESTAYGKGVTKAAILPRRRYLPQMENPLALHLNTDTSMYLFTGHGEGYVAVNDRRFQQPLVVMAQGVRTDWPAGDFAALTNAHFDYFLELKPDILLFGTGPRQQFAHPDLYRELINNRIAVEFMDTPAACRTYN